jgi:pimeloyl-ACP methyl ester carboxylesterase
LSKTDSRQPLSFPCMAESGFKHSGGMHVVHDGPRQAPPLLLIHGSGASGASWGPVVSALAGRHHVIRVDLSGCGKSPPTPSYDVPGQATRVAALLDDLGLGRVTVVGHSSGGYVATAVTEHRSDMVSSLVLISTGPSPGALLPQPVLVRVVSGPPLGPLVWALRSDAMLRKGFRSVCNLPVDVPNDVVAEMRGIGYRRFRAVLRQNGEYLAERSIPERLISLDLDIPILVIFGAADRRWDPSSVHQYDVVPYARVVQLPDVGHLPMFEAPGLTSRLLLDFAASVADNPSRDRPA